MGVTAMRDFGFPAVESHAEAQRLDPTSTARCSVLLVSPEVTCTSSTFPSNLRKHVCYAQGATFADERVPHPKRPNCHWHRGLGTDGGWLFQGRRPMHFQKPTRSGRGAYIHIRPAQSVDVQAVDSSLALSLNPLKTLWERVRVSYLFSYHLSVASAWFLKAPIQTVIFPHSWPAQVVSRTTEARRRQRRPKIVREGRAFVASQTSCMPGTNRGFSGDCVHKTLLLTLWRCGLLLVQIRRALRPVMITRRAAHLVV
ncbi:uncharacterized protein F5Z01DRAFT_665600 [Emericellopsis atlantica]|uniref:Uncharacterized protein n=1 Tax=Emericellopsis atlantica TaxID=2614577 RepID=A0A9P7ZEJ1_9HYPO|nr:uncharacterized protein F5Z01DRAFT_665600 [Emericellopsis atlantica]KAG9250658.1 hypothetical protein F5Z01DRAFT_665600 [Emericellopsis atlantica]